MAKSGIRLHEVEEMSDERALMHSRSKYVRFEEAYQKEIQLYEDDNEKITQKSYNSKHTLDSDEEEEIKYDKLDMNKACFCLFIFCFGYVEGQEEPGREYEGDTKITAFNMHEDMEDGHFDTYGNFIFDKKQDEIKDAWLDNIDWTNVKANAGDQWQQKNEEDNSTTKNIDHMELKHIYKRIASLLKKNETIERALSRFGKQKGYSAVSLSTFFSSFALGLSAAEERKKRWAAKKAGTTYVDEGDIALKELTGLTDSLVSNGEFEAYQYTLERLEYMIRELEHKAVDVLDIFSNEPVSSSFKAATRNKEDNIIPENVVMWEYKLSDDQNAEIFGPVSSKEMIKLQNEGKFDNGGWARKKDTQAFYTLARLDFEIYI
ncbi:unnamed protein product [Thelazia callipaeda]|uniref:GYF domain-containing protein n=1 Tax=Thelazia callipaeda TaxID=103827 RepID=A0A0N5CZG6_THECL|nr:unnamed protein product [Thelazia callipaeda]